MFTWISWNWNHCKEKSVHLQKQADWLLSAQAWYALPFSLKRENVNPPVSERRHLRQRYKGRWWSRTQRLGQFWVGLKNLNLEPPEKWRLGIYVWLESWPELIWWQLRDFSKAELFLVLKWMKAQKVNVKSSSTYCKDDLLKSPTKRRPKQKARHKGPPE